MPNSKTKPPFLQWVSHNFLPNALFTLFIVYLVLTYQQVTAQTGEKDSLSKPPLVTSTFAYQGFLTNTTGQPINGNRALTFRLYSVPTGGTAIWTEVRNVVSIQNGLFNVRLGELIPIPPSVWDTSALYLGVQVETEAELSPREPIGLVPVAQQALEGFPKLIGLDESETIPAVTVTSFAGWNPVKGENANDNIEVTLSTDGSPLLVMITAQYVTPTATTGQYRWCAIEIVEGGTEITHYQLEGLKNGVEVFGCSGSLVISDLPAGTYTFRAVGLVEDASIPITWQLHRQIAVFDLPPIE